ncbi:uncharacterized protein [Amphiura filiformis]|uniref:uncharacterized protein n=1 Tax=Amphiura filiformis TaxID=82378 RepID=UPI003B225BE0
MWKALELRNSTTAELREAENNFGVSVSQLDEWVSEEKKHFPVERETDEPFTKEERYVILLQSMERVTESLSECDDDDAARSAFQQQLTRLGKDAEKLQRDIGANRQWCTTDRCFKRAKSSVDKKRKERILKRLHKQAMDYMFIKDLRAKYSDGQAIGNRLTKNQIRAGNGMKRSVNEYNNSGFSNQSGNLPDQISWNDICNPLGEIYNRVDCIDQSRTSDDQLPRSERARLINVRNLNQRAQEEIGMTRTEMGYVLEATSEEHKAVVRAITNNNENKALQVVLREKAEKVRRRYHRCRSVFSKHTQVPDIPEQLCNPLDSKINLTERELKEEVTAIDLEDTDEELEE